MIEFDDKEKQLNTDKETQLSRWLNHWFNLVVRNPSVVFVRPPHGNWFPATELFRRDALKRPLRRW